MNIIEALSTTIYEVFDETLFDESVSRNIDKKTKDILLNLLKQKINVKLNISSEDITCKPIKTDDPIKSKQPKTIQSNDESSTEEVEKIDSTKCICRIWNTGLGTQCNKDKKHGDYCNSHFKKKEKGIIEFGLITDPRPTNYIENTELKGKKSGSKIKWKNVAKTSSEKSSEKSKNKEQQINAEVKKTIELDEDQQIKDQIDLESDEQELLKKQLSVKCANNYNELDEDLSSIEVDDIVKIDGIDYEQFKIDEQTIYLIDSDGKKVAEWNGHDIKTITWSSKQDEIDHENKKQ
jgi:hypothetical protein